MSTTINATKTESPIKYIFDRISSEDTSENIVTVICVTALASLTLGIEIISEVTPERKKQYTQIN